MAYDKLLVLKDMPPYYAAGNYGIFVFSAYAYFNTGLMYFPSNYTRMIHIFLINHTHLTRN